MKYLQAALVAVFTLALLSPASANNIYNSSVLDSIQKPLVCAEEGKKKKKEGDEEPECD